LSAPGSSPGRTFFRTLFLVGLITLALLVYGALERGPVPDERGFHSESGRQRGWHRIIVVTSPYHLRRAGFAMRRELKGTDVVVEMHGTRYEPANPARWWTSREDLRWVLDEGTKLVAYELGLGA
jgi:hypothetical protein